MKLHPNQIAEIPKGLLEEVPESELGAIFPLHTFRHCTCTVAPTPFGNSFRWRLVSNCSVHTSLNHAVDYNYHQHKVEPTRLSDWDAMIAEMREAQ